MAGVTADIDSCGEDAGSMISGLKNLTAFGSSNNGLKKMFWMKAKCSINYTIRNVFKKHTDLLKNPE